MLWKDLYFIGSPLNLMISAVGFLMLRTISDMSSSGVESNTLWRDDSGR